MHCRLPAAPNTSHPHVPLFAIASATAGGSFSATLSTQNIAYTQTAAANMPKSVPECYLRQHAFETLAHDLTPQVLHARTHCSWRLPLALLPAACQPAQTLCTSPTRTQQQRNSTAACRLTRRERKALSQGWRREAPFRGERRQTAGRSALFRPCRMQCRWQFRPLTA